MHITLVKKIMEDGNLCPKCREVSEQIAHDNHLDKVNYIAIADASDNESEGMRLANRFKAKCTPFFVIEFMDGRVKIIELYSDFKQFLEDSASNVQLEELA